MVALFNGVGGGAAALVALAEFHDAAPEPGRLDADVSVSIVLSALIGSVSFAGSMVAFAKLQELIHGRPITYPGQQFVNGVLLAGDRRARDRDRRRAAGRRWLLVALIVGALALRRPVRPADRRRGHAGRDLAAERVHRPRRRRDRLRAARERADRERRARRRVRDAADADDGPGDEPLDRERPLRRVRPGAGAGARPRRPARTAPCAPTTRRGRRGHARATRKRVDRRARLRAGGRAGAARRARARRRAREARRRRRATRSIRSPAACRAT